MQVHNDESLANDIGSEPCIDGGDTMGEASAGVCIGQPLSRENSNWDADAVDVSGWQHGYARYREHMAGPARSQTGAMCRSSSLGLLGTGTS